MILGNDLSPCILNKLLIYIFYHRNLVNKLKSGSKFSPPSCNKQRNSNLQNGSFAFQ